jgi:hypothetical protein
MVPVLLPLVDVEVVAGSPNGIGAGVLVLAALVPGATTVPIATMVPCGTMVPVGRITTVPGCTTDPGGTIVPGGVANDEVVAPPVLGGGLAVAGADEVVCVGNDEVGCADAGEQLTLVPGVVGSEASGTGASVVPGVPGCVVAENGLGPFSGDVTIAPGVDGRPMAVLPMVETCARLALLPASRMAVVSSKRRIAIPPSARRPSWCASCCGPRPCCLPPGSPLD